MNISEPSELTSSQIRLSALEYGKLLKFHLRLPLDLKVLQYSSKQKDLMKYIANTIVEDSTESINFQDAVSKNQDYEKFLAFVLFRLYYAYDKHQSDQFYLQQIISDILDPLTQKVESDAEGLSVRLVFIFNVTQILLEDDEKFIYEAIKTIGSAAARIYSPLNEKQMSTARCIQEKFEKITDTELFMKGVKEYLDLSESKMNPEYVIQACRNMKITAVGIKGLTRVIGINLPEGIALNFRYSSLPEFYECILAKYLVVLIHNLGQYIGSLLRHEKLTTTENAFSLEKSGFSQNNKGYKFQSIIFGGLRKWWIDSNCRKKLFDIQGWPSSLPLFNAKESENVEEQEVTTTYNSSMFLNPPIESNICC